MEYIETNADACLYLTNVQYWDQQRDSQTTDIVQDTHLRPYLENLLPKDTQWTCLEVGAVPGGLLLWFATHFGYRPTGMDFSDAVTKLPVLFSRHGVQADSMQADFLTYAPPPTLKYDVVFSMGFVEHFVDFNDVVQRHWALVRVGGFMVIGMPAWTPVQRAIRRVVYTREHYRQICRSHNTGIMNLQSLVQAVDACPDAQIILARYIREMTVWITPSQRGVRKLAKPLLSAICRFSHGVNRAGLSSSLFSPELLVVAKRLR